ncbi:LpxL/LpxP family acyltransferase [Aliamphritea ceti]|uniref:LpxL/LpxP family acyltransferase n=1 Tax=Aliamphritea ceti TaxID=1524258 RepID=UPI0021C3F742|nr:lipid A biosynthesis acyltransferase [Aliamphritea ceti]
MSEMSRHWSRVGEAGTVAGMRILLFIYILFGRVGFRAVLWPVMAYYYLVHAKARQHSAEYLARVKPFLSSQQARELTSFKHFLAFGEALLDKLIVWMGRISDDNVEFATPDAFAHLDTGQRGGIIIVSHLGNSEICNALAHQARDVRLTILVHTRHAVKFNSVLKKLNTSNRIELLQVTEMSPATAMLLSERIDAGEYVVIAGDRVPVNNPGRTSTVTFLGESADLPQGAFILAALLRCPVHLLFCLKQQGTYHLYLEIFAERLKLPRKERQAELDKYVQQYAQRLEHYCIKAPLQWFNFYPFWGERNT